MTNPNHHPPLDTPPHDHTTTKDNPMHHTPSNTTTLWQAEEADREAAERARVNEWVAEHPDPVSAALARAVAAEVEVVRLRDDVDPDEADWEAAFHRAEDEAATLAVEVEKWKHIANVRGKREVWLAEERDKAQAKADRYDALRADVVEQWGSYHPRAVVAVELLALLDRDDERATQ